MSKGFPQKTKDNRDNGEKLRHKVLVAEEKHSKKD